MAQRSVFLLHHEDDGLSLDELARALGGLETAKSRLRYAMGKLRGCMGAHLPAEMLMSDDLRPGAGASGDLPRDAHLRTALRHAPDHGGAARGP